MRILLHCIYYPPEVGGLESHVSFLARALVQRGHEVSVVTSRSLPEAPSREILDGVKVYRTRFPHRSPLGWGAFALLSTPRALAQAREADVLHAQAFASIPPLAVARWRWRKPLAATFHTSHFLTRARSRWWRPILAGLVRIPDYVLAASGEIATVARELGKGLAVEALTNGVDTELFRPTAPTLAPAPDRARLLVPRRLFPKNGVEYLVKALPRILRDCTVEAVIVGDGPERERLEALAAALGVTDHVRFLGKRAHEEMPGLLSSATAVIIPSLMEATSVAALEAMSCGVPVVASRVGGLPEIVDEEVGGLFAPGDPEDLARTVVRLLREADLRALGKAGRARVVERWSNDRLVDRHLEIYEELLRTKGKR